MSNSLNYKGKYHPLWSHDSHFLLQANLSLPWADLQQPSSEHKHFIFWWVISELERASGQRTHAPIKHTTYSSAHSADMCWALAGPRLALGTLGRAGHEADLWPQTSCSCNHPSAQGRRLIFPRFASYGSATLGVTLGQFPNQTESSFIIYKTWAINMESILHSSHQRLSDKFTYLLLVLLFKLHSKM